MVLNQRNTKNKKQYFFVIGGICNLRNKEGLTKGLPRKINPTVAASDPSQTAWRIH